LLSRFVEVRALPGSASVEGGDVVAAGQRYFIGVTRRTSQTGAEKLAAELAALGLQPQVVPLPGKQFLRNHLSWLGGDRVLASGWVAEHPAFAGLEHIVPLPDEAAGANAICLGRHVLLPEGCPELAGTLKGLGYEVSSIPVSEFQKMDGSLSSLALLW
jgi:dimethylargininase